MSFPELGNFLLYVAFALSVYSTATSIVSGKTRRLDVTLTSERAISASFALIAIAFLILEYLILPDRFDVYYVAKASSRDLHTGYKMTAIWASMEGSLLLWSLVLEASARFAVRKMRTLRGQLAY